MLYVVWEYIFGQLFSLIWWVPEASHSDGNSYSFETRWKMAETREANKKTAKKSRTKQAAKKTTRKMWKNWAKKEDFHVINARNHSVKNLIWPVTKKVSIWVSYGFVRIARRHKHPSFRINDTSKSVSITIKATKRIPMQMQRTWQAKFSLHQKQQHLQLKHLRKTIWNERISSSNWKNVCYQHWNKMLHWKTCWKSRSVMKIKR